MPGMVLRTKLVEKVKLFRKGEGLFVLEAMKMEKCFKSSWMTEWWQNLWYSRWTKLIKPDFNRVWFCFAIICYVVKFAYKDGMDGIDSEGSFRQKSASTVF